MRELAARLTSDGPRLDPVADRTALLRSQLKYYLIHHVILFKGEVILTLIK